MKFKQFVVNEAEKKEKDGKESKSTMAAKKKARKSLKIQLQKLDTEIDKIMDNVELEVDKIEENPVFKGKVGQMLLNTEKESGEFIIALRQLINTLSRNASIIPTERGHAPGISSDGNDEKAAEDKNKPKIVSKKEVDKAVSKI